MADQSHSTLLFKTKSKLKWLLSPLLETVENKLFLYVLYCLTYQMNKHLLKVVSWVTICKTQENRTEAGIRKCSVKSCS